MRHYCGTIEFGSFAEYNVLYRDGDRSAYGIEDAGDGMVYAADWRKSGGERGRELGDVQKELLTGTS